MWPKKKDKTKDVRPIKVDALKNKFFSEKNYVARESKIRVKSVDNDSPDDTATTFDYQNKIKGLEEEIKKLKENDKTTDDSTSNEKGILKNATIRGVKSEPENIKYKLTDWKKTNHLRCNYID